MSVPGLIALPNTQQSRLSSSELLEIAHSWVSRLRETAATETDQRWYCQLEHHDSFEVWLIGWSGTQATEVHDHGGSAGAVVVAAGEVVEHRFHAPTGVIRKTTLASGETISFDHDVIHDVQNAGGPPSLTVHVYSPPLTQQTYYDVSNGTVLPNKLVDVDSPESNAIDRSADIDALVQH